METSVGGIPAAAVAIGDVSAQFTALAVLGASNKQISMSLPGVKAGDVLSVRILSAIPDGYDVGQAFCLVDGTVIVVVNHPALVLNANFSIPLRVYRIMS